MDDRRPPSIMSSRGRTCPRHVCWLAATVLAFATTLGADAEERVGVEVPDRTPRPSHEISWRLAWSREGIIPFPDRPGFALTNDLGHRVEVEAAWLTTWSTALVPCPEAVGSRARSLGWFAGRALTELGLNPTEAFAGHTGIGDPSALDLPQLEDLIRLATVDAAPMEVPPRRYCTLPVRVARPPGAPAAVLPGGIDLSRTSLFVRGRWTVPGGKPLPFIIQTARADGVLLPLPAPGVIDTGRQDARVTVWRSVGTLFDGVDLPQMEPAEVERRAMRNLRDSVRLELTLNEARTDG